MEEQQSVTFKERMEIFLGGSALSLSLGVGSLFFHSFPGEPILLLGPMIISLAQGKPIRDAMLEFRAYLAPEMSKKQFSEIVDKHVENENSHLDQSASAKLKRILSLFTSSENNEVPQLDQRKTVAFSDQASEVVDPFEDLREQSSIIWATLEMFASLQPGQLFISQDQYETYTIQRKNMFHTLIAARTGSGKTELIKLLAMQLVKTCAVRFIHPMFSPVDLVDDKREISCWGPILGKLKNNPQELVENYPKINNLFLEFEKLLSKRAKEKSQPGKQATWTPAYLIVDEGQIITDHCDDAKRVIGRIVKEGRQLKVFIILVCQSAQVQNLGLNKGDLSQFLTKFYLGTDETTRKYLVPELSDEVEERHFTQKGRVAFVSPEHRGIITTQLPLIPNEVLYSYFGETFDKGCFVEWLSSASDHEDPFEELEIEEDTMQNDHSNNEMNTASNFKFQIEDAVSYAIEELRKTQNTATLNAVIRKVNNENDFNINSHTHTSIILNVAKDYGFEIVEGKAGRR